MKLVEYLKEIYGYNNPIILKDLRIGGKSKSAIRQELYRECKNGNINSFGNGVYYIKLNEQKYNFLPENKLSFEDVMVRKYISDDLKMNFIRYGYVSGQTFLNQLGISQQVPGKIEITTNKTSSKKRMIFLNGRYAILRKSRTKIDAFNWKILQFLDMFHFLDDDDLKKNKDKLSMYIKENGFTESLFNKYISLYSTSTIKKICESGLIYDFR